jgi:hypothetical protein
MKTAISIPDELFTRAERLARRLKKSRSELYAEAVEEFLERREPDAVTLQMDRVCDTVGACADPALSAAAVRVLNRTEW